MKVSKQDVLKRSTEVIASKKNILTQALHLLEESLTAETKSSAGDKHETGRARLQDEQGKLQAMFNELLELEMTVQALDRSGNAGRMVNTDKGLFFLGLSLGRVEVNGEMVFVISASSPLGAELYKRDAGELFTFRDISYKVLEVA